MGVVWAVAQADIILAPSALPVMYMISLLRRLGLQVVTPKSIASFKTVFIYANTTRHLFFSNQMPGSLIRDSDLIDSGMEPGKI